MNPNDKTAVLTAKEFGELIGADYLSATALLKYMVKHGIAQEAGKRAAEGGRGKPSSLFSVPDSAELVFWEPNGEAVEATPEAAPEVSPEATPEVAPDVELETSPEIEEKVKEELGVEAVTIG